MSCWSLYVGIKGSAQESGSAEFVPDASSFTALSCGVWVVLLTAGS